MSLADELRTLGGSSGVVVGGVRRSADLSRVAALPRRILEPTEALADKWTERLKRPEGNMRLRPIQAVAIEEAYQTGGLLGCIGTGFGKTLVSLLLPVVWGSERAALLVPPNLKTKLFQLEHPELSKHWQLPEIVDTKDKDAKSAPKGALYVVTYSQLSSIRTADVLDELQVDDLICDEIQNVANPRSARSRRFRRVARSPRPRATPSVAYGDDRGGGGGLLRRRIAGLSGSITGRSTHDYDHLAALICGNGSPLPLDWNAQQEWGLALNPDTGGPRLHPGALEVLGKGEIRDVFRRRLVETPGVVATSTNDPGMGLIFNQLPLTTPKPVLDALDHVRTTWTRPDGVPLRETIEVYAVQRQLACGFYYRRVYPRGEPPAVIDEWVAAKKDWDLEVRDRLSRGIKGQDSVKQCANWAESGKWASRSYARWAAVKDTVKPEKEAVWISRFLVEAAVEWAQTPGVIWVEAEAVRAAFEIASTAGIPVYAGGKDDEAALLKEDGSRAIIASMKAFGEGVNLQHAFSRALITTCPSSARMIEQVVAREHRPRDPAKCTGPVGFHDDVIVDFYLHTPEIVDALRNACKKAEYIENTTGNKQKINTASWLFSSAMQINLGSRYKG